MNNTKVLVTGANGLLGSNVVYQLLKQDREVVAMVRSEKIKENPAEYFGCYKDITEKEISSIHFVIGDVTDIIAVNEATKDVGEVIHCAGLISFSKSDHEKMYNTNVIGVKNIVNACLENNIKKLVHISSIAALGPMSKSKDFIDENTVFNKYKKRGMYATSKEQGEREVWRGISEGLNAVIFNPGVITGTGCGKNAVNSMFPLIDKLIKFYTKGSTGYVDVKDVATAAVSSLNKDISGERFILVAENLSVKQLFTIISDLTQKPKPKLFISTPLLKFAGFFESSFKRIIKKKELLPTEFIRSLTEETKYTSYKYLQTFGLEFTDIKLSLDETLKRVNELKNKK